MICFELRSSFVAATAIIFFCLHFVFNHALNESFAILLKDGSSNDYFVNLELGSTNDPAVTVATFCQDYNLLPSSCSALDNIVRRKYFHNGDTFGDWNESFEYVFITAFYDIGRGKWTEFKRSEHDYMQNFHNLLQINIPLVVFIDEKYYDLTRAAIIKYRTHNHLFTKVITINENFLTKNILSWSYIEVEEAIMSTHSYQQAILTRPEQLTPETLYPRYNCINHAKIDFIKYVIDHEYSILPTHIGYLGWVDFGYISIESAVLPFELNSQLLFSDHVSVLNTVPIDPLVDSDPLTVLSLSLAKIHGAFWFGSNSALLRYHTAYHRSLQSMHDVNIADDDQAVMLQVVFNEPGLLKLWRNAPLWGYFDWGWYVGFILFNRLLWESLSLVKLVAQANQQIHLVDQQNELPTTIVLVRES